MFSEKYASATAPAKHAVRPLHSGLLVPLFDITYSGKVNLDPSNQVAISEELFCKLNARLAYILPGGRFKISGWVDNLLGQQSKTEVFDLMQEYNLILEYYADPRTYGLTASLLW